MDLSDTEMETGDKETCVCRSGESRDAPAKAGQTCLGKREAT